MKKLLVPDQTRKCLTLDQPRVGVRNFFLQRRVKFIRLISSL